MYTLTKFSVALVLSGFVSASQFHSNPLQKDVIYNSMDEDPSEPSLEDVWGGLWPFQGINTFAHLDHHQCLVDPDTRYDIALIGVPFDTATSYRPGARFGPRAIRSASQRQHSLRGYNHRAKFNPYASWATVVDCGDIPVTPMDNALAFKQMTKAFEELIVRRHASANESVAAAPPRYVALGGDHAVLLPHIRALHSIYGKINVIHFDAHLDTWSPEGYPSFWHSDQNELNHGSMLWKAYKEGLTSTHNIHAGLRTRLTTAKDYEDDDMQHFSRIEADDIWIKGVDSVVEKILATVPADTPTYISVDIDVLDPGFASGTGTQEPGGWLPRELLYVLRKLEGLSIVGADVVEVSPAFDNAEITATNGAQVAYELITSMVKKGALENLVVSRAPEQLVKVESGPVESEIERKLKELEDIKKKFMQEIQELRDEQIP
ncbi:guanidinobutyrase [[Candida] anglica]|uniref:Guanidinobutyrase n=1 Tax=[Candida] anglica TaxID=148631 RepID=A0ABP0EGV6_9ASCO